MLKSMTFTTASPLMSPLVLGAGRLLKLESKIDRSITVMLLSLFRSPLEYRGEVLVDPEVGVGFSAGVVLAAVVFASMETLLALSLPRLSMELIW